MISEEKVKQVLTAIKENSIKSFTNEELAKLLSILTEEEYDILERKSYQELGGASAQIRISSLRPYVSFRVNKELNEVYNSQIFKLFLESLKRREYYAYLKSLKVEELASLKKYFSYTYAKNNPSTKKAFSKVIQMITKEIINKEQNKNLVF